MREVGAFEAKTHLSRLLDQVDHIATSTGMATDYYTTHRKKLLIILRCVV